MAEQKTFDLDRARQMRDEGKPWTAIAEFFHTSHATIRMKLDEKYAAARRQRINKRRQQVRAHDTPAMYYIAGRTPKDDIAARLAEIPKDTRTRAQILMGDPIPARSALAQWIARNQ